MYSGGMENEGEEAVSPRGGAKKRKLSLAKREREREQGDDIN